MEALLIAIVALMLLAPASRSSAVGPDRTEPPRRPRPEGNLRHSGLARESEMATHRRRLAWLDQERRRAEGDPDALRRCAALFAAEVDRHREKIRRLASEEPSA